MRSPLLGSKSLLGLGDAARRRAQSAPPPVTAGSRTGRKSAAPRVVGGVAGGSAPSARPSSSRLATTGPSSGAATASTSNAAALKKDKKARSKSSAVADAAAGVLNSRQQLVVNLPTSLLGSSASGPGDAESIHRAWGEECRGRVQAWEEPISHSVVRSSAMDAWPELEVLSIKEGPAPARRYVVLLPRLVLALVLAVNHLLSGCPIRDWGQNRTVARAILDSHSSSWEGASGAAANILSAPPSSSLVMPRRTFAKKSSTLLKSKEDPVTLSMRENRQPPPPPQPPTGSPPPPPKAKQEDWSVKKGVGSGVERRQQAPIPRLPKGTVREQVPARRPAEHEDAARAAAAQHERSAAAGVPRSILLPGSASRASQSTSAVTGYREFLGGWGLVVW
jgi:hypothetical protein